MALADADKWHTRYNELRREYDANMLGAAEAAGRAEVGLAELRAAGVQTPSYDDIVHADESTYPQYAPGPLQQLLAETRARVGAVVTPEKN